MTQQRSQRKGTTHENELSIREMSQTIREQGDAMKKRMEEKIMAALEDFTDETGGMVVVDGKIGIERMYANTEGHPRADYVLQLTVGMP